MKVRKHFRTSLSTIDYIIADLSLNRITDKEKYFKICVNKRMQKMNTDYDEKLDKILAFIIKRCTYDNMPIRCLSRIILSLSHITNALSKGFISIISE